MILKSTSRKDTNFRQIVAYLHKEQRVGEQAITYLHNMNVSDPDDFESIIKAFQENEQYRKQRKKGVVFFHEIMAFAPKDSVEIFQNPDLLRDLIDRYIQLRAPHAVVLAKPHVEENHIHIHFVISGSEWGSDCSTRVSRFDLEKIKEQIRAYQREQYPELEHSYQPNRGEVTISGHSHATWQMEKRGQVQDKKERLKTILLNVLKESPSWNELIKLLSQNGIRTYKRQGRIAGIIWQDRKYRFTTLIKEEKKHQRIEQLLVKETDLSKENKLLDLFDVPVDSEQWLRIQQELEEMERTRQQWVQRREHQKDLGLDQELEI